MIKNMRQGMVVLVAMTTLFLISVLIVVPLENRGNPYVSAAGATQTVSAVNPGGKRLRFPQTVPGTQPPAHPPDVAARLMRQVPVIGQLMQRHQIRLGQRLGLLVGNCRV